MNRLVLLLISLISTSTCIYYTSVGVDEKTVLSPGNDKDSYFYLQAYRYSRKGIVYLLVQDQGNGFEYNDMEICYSDSTPSSHTIKDCNFERIFYYSKDPGDVDKKNYYYKFNYVDKKDYIFREYIIVHFKTYSSILTVKCSTEDIYQGIKEKESRYSFSTFKIILVCTGLLIFLASVITCIVYLRSCFKKMKFIGPQLKEEQQSNLAAEIPENFPLEPPQFNQAINVPSAS